MKVLVIGPSPTRSKGGMATVINDILDDSELVKDYNIENYDSYVDGNIVKIILYSAWAIFKFIVTGKAKKYDVYHIHSASKGSNLRKMIYLKIVKKQGKKVIFHIHGGGYMAFYNSLSEKRKKRVVKTLQSADMVIALSQDWKNQFVDKFGLSNCEILENGINTECFAPAINECGKYKNSFLMLGRLCQNKGVYDLIDAVQAAKTSIPNLKCYLAGDGDVEKVRSIVSERNLNDNIEVVGWANFDKKTQLLSKVATVVLPSYNEGLPMTILEGMACGKAIISTTVGAIPEVVTDENGIIINPGDVNALADAIVLCSKDTEMLKRMQSANIKKIDELFSMHKMHKILREYYEALR